MGLLQDALSKAGDRIAGRDTAGIKPAPGTQLNTSVGSEVRANLPEVDTTIDPGEFAAGAPVQGEIATLEPPQDIDAANIGAYTPYEAVTDEVAPESTVEGRLTGLLSQQNPYIERARTRAAQLSNRRGLLNTSMAAGAAEGAAIDRALPIAQQDAAAHLEMQFRNQGYSNDAARYLAEQSVERANLQAGLDQQTSEFNAQRQFEQQKINQATAQRVYDTYAAEQNRNNFAVLNADLTTQIRAIDNELAMNLEQLTREYSIMENLDSINGQIYQQAVADMGTILANEKDPGTARAKINTLIKAAGIEFEFSTGEAIGSQGQGPQQVSAPEPKPSLKYNPWTAEETGDQPGGGIWNRRFGVSAPPGTSSDK